MTAPKLNINHITRFTPVNDIVLNFILFHRLKPAKVKIIGAAEVSIIAIIINDHMMKIAIMFAADHREDMGIISIARGFFMSNAAHARNTHPAREVKISRLKVTDSDFKRLKKLDSDLFTLVFKMCRNYCFIVYTKLNTMIINFQIFCA